MFSRSFIHLEHEELEYSELHQSDVCRHKELLLEDYTDSVEKATIS